VTRIRLVVAATAFGFFAVSCSGGPLGPVVGQSDADVDAEIGGDVDDGSADPIPVEADGGIGGSAGEIPFFGANDTVCVSVELKNELNDDGLRAEAFSCFMDEYDAGRAVVVDMSVPTVEGDPIFERYATDGNRVTLVIDTRLDAYGAGEVLAQACAGAEWNGKFINGVDCESIDHPGFPEAEQ